MLKTVEVEITSKTDGLVDIVPYSSGHGLLRRTDELGHTWLQVYKVPAYVALIHGGDIYLAVRFGLVNDGKLPPPKIRRCDAGVAHHAICTPSWNPTYGTHTLVGLGSPGAWVLWPGKKFYIHRGGNRAKNERGGATGCVEILDGKWDHFLDQIQRLGNGSCAHLGAEGKVKVTVRSAACPMAVFVGQALTRP
jgi:hypothetical protein